MELTAQMEPFDTFWEAPDNVEKGYASFSQFYRSNYLPHVPPHKDADILIISCGPGYFVNLLREEGYRSILGIDSDPAKLEHALARGLPCREERAFAYLQECDEQYDLIFCEQELNHLTKSEILEFLLRCRARLKDGGRLIVHVLNGANPITGAESLALNFDHYNIFTEYSLRQVFDHTHFSDVTVIPLRLYVFFRNPLNYLGILATGLLELFFRLSFILYGKKNRLFTKKIAAIAIR